LREESEQLGGHISQGGGHKSQEIFFCVFGPSYFSAVGGRTVRIRTSPYKPYGFGTENRGSFGHSFRGRFHILFVVSGPYKQSVQLTVGTKIEVQKRSYNNTEFGTKNEAEFGGTVLVL
jgi:hypothetical protein